MDSLGDLFGGFIDIAGDMGTGSEGRAGQEPDAFSSVTRALERAAERNFLAQLTSGLSPRRRRSTSRGARYRSGDHYAVTLTRLQSTAQLARLLQRAHRNI